MNKLTGSNLLKIQEYLQSHREKSSLSLKIKFSTNQKQNLLITKIIEKELSQLTHLTDLALHISKYSILTVEGYLILSQILINLNALKKLSIKIDWECFLENEGLRVLSDIINNLPELVSLKCEIGGKNYINAETAQSFLDSLKANTKLTTLKLSFDEIKGSSTNSANENNINFWRGISNLTNLERLKIYIATDMYGYSDLTELFAQIANLNQLRSLHLIITDASQIEHNNLLDELFPQIGKMIELRQLKLDCDYSNLTDLQRKTIIKNLNNLKYLEKLRLYDLEEHLFKNNFREYIDLIRGLKYLTEVDLDIPNDKAQDPDLMTSLGQSLLELKDLIKLKLVMIYRDDDDDNMIRGFYQNLSISFSQMHNLRSFNLVYQGSLDKIQSDMIGESFQFLKQLEILKLNLNFLTMTNKTGLLRGIRNLTNLKEIDLILEFKQFKGKEEERTLLDSIQQLSQLERLRLDLKIKYSFEGIKNLEALSKTLKNLRKLKYLEFQLLIESLETQVQLDLLEECFEHLSDLECLKLIISIQERNTTDLEIRSIINHLPNLKQLQIYFYRKYLNLFRVPTQTSQKLENCSLIFHRKVTVQDFQEILESLSQTSIRKLDLDLNYLDIEDKEQLETVFSNLSYLEKLSIKVGGGSYLMAFVHGIKAIKQLKSLSIEVNDSDLTKQAFQELDQNLNELDYLQKLKINNYNTIDQEIDIFSLKSQMNLKHFKFGFFYQIDGERVHNNIEVINACSLDGQQLNQKSLENQNLENNLNKAVVDDIQQQDIIQNEQQSQLSQENQLRVEDNLNRLTQQMNPIEIYIDVSHENQKQLELSWNQLHSSNTQYLNKLDIKCNFYLNNELQLLCQLRDLTSESKLEFLTLNLDMLALNVETISNLSRNFKFLTNLKSLELVSVDSKDYYHFLFDSFKYLINLQKIKIRINLSQNGAVSLGNSLKSMRKLESCELIFDEKSAFESNGFYSIFNGLKQVTRMKQLTLTMNTDQIIQNEDNQYLLSESIQNMKVLQSLSFSIGINQISSASLREFFTSIGSLVFLKTLNLEINEANPFNQDMLEELIKAMNQLTVLSEYNISSYLETNKTIKISEDFAILFNKNPTDQLVVSTKEIELTFVQSDSRLFSFKSQSYQNLEVKFIEYLNESVEVWFAFEETQILKNLKIGNSRKKISLSFEQLRDEKDIETICQFISKTLNLLELEIAIYLNSNLNIEDSIQNIAQSLSKLKSLRVLNMKLISEGEELEMNCHQLMIVISALKELKSIQQLYLKTGNRDLNESMIPKIIKSILRQVILDYDKQTSLYF